MKPEDYGEALAYETAFWLQGFENPDYPVEQLGKLSIELATNFRVLAIMVLLIKGDSDLFHHNLIRSGRIREAYLLRLRDQDVTQDHHQASGRYESLLDSLAAADFDLARRIIAFSPDTMQIGHEYEDDYCYAQLLHQLVLRGSASTQLIQQFEDYLDGVPDARLEVCKALHARQQNMFDQAFDKLLQARSDQITADKARHQMEDPKILAQREIYIEGLALLRLAEMFGLLTQPDYLYCPSLARQTMLTAFPGK